MLDDIFVIYENAGSVFPTYQSAWNNHYKSHIKKVRYIFTPTYEVCNTVGELSRCAQRYFKSNDCSYIDVVNKASFNQLSLI